jgi:hypothetical protein
MKVKNAKHSELRANGEYRTIVLENITKSEMTALIIFSDLVKKFMATRQNHSVQELEEEFYEPVRRSLHNVLRKLHPQLTNYPTLYSTRHQAVANAKASGISAIEIAALFGHSSVKTAREHYGSKKDAWGKCKWKPSEESILGVRNKIQLSKIDTLTAQQEEIIADLPDDDSSPQP